MIQVWQLALEACNENGYSEAKEETVKKGRVEKKIGNSAGSNLNGKNMSN